MADKNDDTKKQRKKAKAERAATDEQPRELGEVRWAESESLGERMIQGLTEFAEALEAGEPIEKRFTMRTVDLDLEPMEFSPDDVKALREELRASQAVFAELLGASVKTVQSWEQGTAPNPMARRLLETMKEDPAKWRAKLEAAVRERPANAHRITE